MAAFTAPAQVAVGAPIAFDARTSSDADGDALTYSWDFGAGRRGGGARIARIFDTPGNITVRLTVDDGRGGANAIERSVTVTPGPAAIGAVNTMAVVRDNTGAALTGVSVALASGGASVTTDDAGHATISTDRGVPVVLTFSKAGYANQTRVVNLPAAAESGYVEVGMLAREPALTLPSAAAGGTLTGKHGARVTFAPNSLVDAAGNAVTGAVQVSMTPVDIANNVRAFPGRFTAVRTDGTEGLLLTYGTVEFVLTAGGAPVQLAPGKKATIEIPIYARLNLDGSPLAAGQIFPLWSLDPRTGGWIEEGTGTVIAAATPSDFALRGEVTHFSWWNHDQFTAPPARPRPKCLIDTNLDGVAEDLTDTGYCWHHGTGPQQANNQAAIANEQVRAMAEPRTQRIPSHVAEASTPAAGGVALPIPADMDITFRSYAKNGSLMGTKVVRLGPNVEQDVPIILYPVQNNPGTLAVALPYDATFAVSSPGEVDVFTFPVQAGKQYQVDVARAPTSLLDASVSVANGSVQLGGGNVGASAFVTTLAATADGTWTVRVTAGDSAPGAYRIQVKSVVNASCASPTPLAIGSTTNNIAVPVGGSKCFELALNADDIVEVTNTQNLSSEGTARLFAPNGDEVAIDTYGTGPVDGIRLRAAVVSAGPYRLEITNTRTTNGTINGLTPIKLTADGVLTVPQTVAFTGPAGGASERYYIVKSPLAAQRFAVSLQTPTGISQGIDVRPGNVQITTTSLVVVWPPISASAHTLVSVFRANANTAWNFELATSVPETLPLNTDVTLTAAGNGIVKIYRVNTTVDQPLSMGRQWAVGLNLNASLSLLQPGGAPLGTRLAGVVLTPASSDPHTLIVRNSALGTGAFTIRVNTLAPAEPMTLGALQTRSATLALGEVRRYALTPALTAGQVLAFSLDASTDLDVTALPEGGAIYDGGVVLNVNTLRTGWSGPRYVQQNAVGTVLVYSPSQTAGRATGQFTLGVQSPTPVVTALGAPITLTAADRALRLYGFALTSAGNHLLCTTYPGTGGAIGRVWGPSAPFSNYTGDLTASGDPALRDESIGQLRVGQNTLSVTGAAGNAVTARLVALSPQAVITANTAAIATALSTPCERRYFTFVGTAAQSYTLRVTAPFAGTLRVRRLVANDDGTTRHDPPFGTLGLSGSPATLVANTETVFNFTIPASAPFGNGNYAIEVDAENDATGNFSIQLTSP